MDYTYKTKGTCSVQIQFHIDQDVITNITFRGGCNGNLSLISSLLEGWTVEQIDALCKGHRCGMRSTSCADQLACAVSEASKLAKNTNEHSSSERT